MAVRRGVAFRLEILQKTPLLFITVISLIPRTWKLPRAVNEFGGAGEKTNRLIGLVDLVDRNATLELSSIGRLL